MVSLIMRGGASQASQHTGDCRPNIPSLVKLDIRETQYNLKIKAPEAVGKISAP
jgi:hypothetical protein